LRIHVRRRGSLRQKDNRRTQANKSQPTAQEPWHRLFQLPVQIFLQIENRELTGLMTIYRLPSDEGNRKYLWML
jgi:hypothetical protein